MSKHTPGPWCVVSEGMASPKVVDARGLGICHTTYAPTGAEANARLIAAAPLLYEALKRMASIIDKMGDMPDGFIHPSPWQELKCEEVLTQARAAIKAVEEGRPCA